MQFLILYVDQLIGKDIPLRIILELIATNLAYMVVLAAPMAVLVSTLMAFGKFSELNELTALRASGINPIMIIQPVLVAALLLSMSLMWFSNNVLPEANSKARSLFLDIRVKKPGFDLKPNVFYNGINNFTFLVKEIDNITDSLYNVTLFQEPGNNRKRAYIRAEKGKLVSEGDQGLTLYLVNGEITHYVSRNTRTGDENLEKTSFQKYRMTFDLSDLSFSRSNPENRSKSDRTMSADAMVVVVDTLRSEITKYIVDASENPSFKNIYNEGHRSPFIKEEQLTTRTDTVQKGRFITLSHFLEKIHKERILEITRSSLQQEQTYFENTTTNMNWRIKRINKYLVEIHKKYAIPLACVVFVLLGAPIGMMTRKGNFGIAAIISSVILTIYWVSIIQGEKLADRLFITPFWGMWSFNIVFATIGILMILHLSTEISFTRIFKRK